MCLMLKEATGSLLQKNFSKIFDALLPAYQIEYVLIGCDEMWDSIIVA